MTIGARSASRGNISDGRFTKKEHILKSRDFMAAYKNGRSVKKLGIVLVVTDNGLGHNRLGFSISSRGVKQASERNRLRRLFREAYRKNRPLFKKAFDIIIIIRRGPDKEVFYADACKLLLSLANEAGILS